MLPELSVEQRGSTMILHQTRGPNCWPLWESRQWEVYVPSKAGAMNSTDTIPTWPALRQGTKTSFFSVEAIVRFPHMNLSWNEQWREKESLLAEHCHFKSLHLHILEGEKYLCICTPLYISCIFHPPVFDKLGSWLKVSPIRQILIHKRCTEGWHNWGTGLQREPGEKFRVTCCWMW